MLRRNTDAEIAERRKQKWLLMKARGKTRFVWTQGILPVLFVWVMVTPPIELLMDRGSLFSWSTLAPSVVALPIPLIGGYLQGVWKWNDMEKKYPE